MADVGGGLHYDVQQPGVAVLDRLDEFIANPAAQAAVDSLVGIPHNSENIAKDEAKPFCSRATWKHGTCAHKERMVSVPCKSRDCPECGPVGRYRIAERIAFGVRQSPCRTCQHGFGSCWGHPGDELEIARLEVCSCKSYEPSASFQVLTYADDDAENPDYKPKAVRDVENYVTWLRKRVRPTPINHRTMFRTCRDPHTGKMVPKLGDDGRFIPWKVSWDWAETELHYVTTFELTQRGRLHINLIMWPWVEIPKVELAEVWGAFVSVAWVKDDGAVAAEAAKAYSPESLGTYLIKLEQSVGANWGRRVAFSQDWPKLPPEPEVVRAGVITWVREWEMPPGQLANFLCEKAEGVWVEAERGEWEVHVPGQLDCACFDWVEAQKKLDEWVANWSEWEGPDGKLRSDGPAHPWEPWMNKSNQYSG